MINIQRKYGRIWKEELLYNFLQIIINLLAKPPLRGLDFITSMLRFICVQGVRNKMQWRVFGKRMQAIFGGGVITVIPRDTERESAANMLEIHFSGKRCKVTKISDGSCNFVILNSTRDMNL